MRPCRRPRATGTEFVYGFLQLRASFDGLAGGLLTEDDIDTLGAKASDLAVEVLSQDSTRERSRIFRIFPPLFCT